MMFNDAVILLVDDDTWMHRVLSKVISRLEIDIIHTATNGFAGVNLAIEKQPNIILLDLIMPDIDGLVTLKMLKAIDKTKNIPVIIITSNSDFESVGTVLASGASEFIAKPFSFATIQEKIVKVLSAHINSNSNVASNSNTFDNIGLEKDDTAFFNSFAWEKSLNDIDVDLLETTPKTNYKDMGNTYKETAEIEINKILKM